jgi:hypothetical protein
MTPFRDASPKLQHSPFNKRDKDFSGRKPGYPALHDKLGADKCNEGAVVKDKAAILCLAKSCLYETTNNGYVHGQPPATLERHLAEFKAEDTVLVDGSTTWYDFLQGLQWKLSSIFGSRRNLHL